MAQLIETPNTVAFDQLLCAACDAAKLAYPTEAAAIGRGLAIALADGVVLFSDGHANVKSDTVVDLWYTVNGTCTCKSFQFSPGGRCKHRWAKALVKHAHTNSLPTRHEPEYFATYYPVDGSMCDGRAIHTPGGWRFTPNDGAEPLYVSEQALCLGGGGGIYKKQLKEDGSLVEKVCQRALVSWHLTVTRDDGTQFTLGYETKDKTEIMAEYWQGRGYHVQQYQQ